MLKRLTSWILIMMLMTRALAQPCSLAGRLLVDETGRVLNRGEAVFTLVEGALYAVGRPGDYALCDGEGRPLTNDHYEMLTAEGDAILCRQGGLFGALDPSGGVLIDPIWKQLIRTGEGAFLALDSDPYDSQSDELIFVTASGLRERTGSFTACGLRSFCDGCMAFMLSDGLYGYVDAMGRQVIPPDWSSAGDFSDGAAIVSDGAGMGLIDTHGRVLVTPDYAWMCRGDGMIAALTADGLMDIYSADGVEKLYTAEVLVNEAEVCGRYVAMKDADAARLIDPSGVCLCVASRAAVFYPGLDGQVIVADGDWGEACQYLINPDGTAASGRYQRLLPLSGGRYAYMTIETNDLGWDYDSARWGLMDAKGRELLPAQYLEILPCGENRLSMQTESDLILADLDGRPLASWPINETAAPSSEAGA